MVLFISMSKKFLLELHDESQTPSLLEEEFSFTGKILLGLMGVAFLQGFSNAKVKGTPRQIDAIAEVLRSSKRFQDELHKPGATVDSVIEKLGLKNASAAQFEKVLGIKWPL